MILVNYPITSKAMGSLGEDSVAASYQPTHKDSPPTDLASELIDNFDSIVIYHQVIWQSNKWTSLE